MIKRQIEPLGARNILHASLSSRRRTAGHVLALRGSPRIGAPLPIYRVSYAGAASTDPLRKARKVGWQYPIVGGDAPGLAHLIKWHRGLKFGGVSEGGLAQSLLDAALFAEEKLHTLKKTFSARLLEIPSLRMYALWLHSRDKTNFFVSFGEEEHGVKSPFSLVDDMAVQIKTAIRTTAHQSTRRRNK